MGPSSAAVDTLPGPIDASASERENMIGISPALPRHTHGAVRDAIERAVLLRLREQQRHPGQRQETARQESRQ